MYRRFLWIYLRCSGYSNVDCLVCEVFETFQNFELKARFISLCEPDYTIVDKSPWDSDVMQGIIFATEFRNALLFPIQCWKIRRNCSYYVFSIVCGVGGAVGQVKLYSCLACVQKCQKSKFVPRRVGPWLFRVLSHVISQESLVLSRYTSDKCDILWSTTRKCSVTFLYHAIGSTVANTHNAKQDGKVGCDTLECTKTLLYSVYFMVWHKPWHKHECLK